MIVFRDKQHQLQRVCEHTRTVVLGQFSYRGFILLLLNDIAIRVIEIGVLLRDLVLALVVGIDAPLDGVVGRYMRM